MGTVREIVLRTIFQFKRGQSEAWTRQNPLLRAGEPGYELDTGLFKIGNGTTPWNELDYYNKLGVLRRDLITNYDPTYIPQNGEVLLVDVPGEGLMIKVGDGTTPFGQIDYYSGSNSSGANTDGVSKIYQYEGKIYADPEHTVELTPSIGKIYVDQSTGTIYTYDGAALNQLVDELPLATSETAGMVKLYDEKGLNTDGAPTQRLFTSEINKKMEASVSEEDEELLVFKN